MILVNGQTEIIWDGVTRSEALTEEAARIRQDLANLAKNHEWPQVIALLTSHPRLVNTTRLGGGSFYAALHHAAEGGASSAVVAKILSLGGWRTARTANGDRPVEIARRGSHSHLLELLTPSYKVSLPVAGLSSIQGNFHEVIRRRVLEFDAEPNLRFPELEVNLEFHPQKFWFSVPGMYGGFSYSFKFSGGDPKLIVESWSRVCGGSGQRHEITSSGSLLVEEGFV